MSADEERPLPRTLRIIRRRLAKKDEDRTRYYRLVELVLPKLLDLADAAARPCGLSHGSGCSALRPDEDEGPCDCGMVDLVRARVRLSETPL